MEKDDCQFNQILSRRNALVLFRAAVTAMLVACLPRKSSAAYAQSSVSVKASSTANHPTLPACIVRPEQTEGPYFVDEKLKRSDIRSDPSDGSVKDGVLLKLTLRVSGISDTGCTPNAGAMVDIWHCDALGLYSDVNDRSFSTVGKKFLRGYQVTDANGKGQRTLKNAQDGIFRADGDQLLLKLTKTRVGYAATFDVGLKTA